MQLCTLQRDTLLLSITRTNVEDVRMKHIKKSPKSERFLSLSSNQHITKVMVSHNVSFV
jgi:hypothetical protein